MEENEEIKAHREAFERFEGALMWGSKNMPGFIPNPSILYQNTIKLAKVEIDGKEVMLGVSNKDMKGYEMEENIPTWKTPIKEQKYDKFIRWCTSFDV